MTTANVTINQTVVSTPEAPKRVRAPRNVTELRNDLLAVYAGLRNKEIDNMDAKEAANLAGKVIGSVKIQLQVAVLAKEVPNIPFLK